MNKQFLLFIAICILFLTGTVKVSGQSKSACYAALSGSSIKAIDTQISNIKSTALTASKLAFWGALEMRKAGLVSVPAKKLSTFKQGHKKLESAIDAEPANSEFRFLRLMIQENAPKSLGYSKNITEDSKMVRDNFQSLPAITKQSVETYSKKSKSLPPFI